LANQLYASYAKAVRVRVLASVVGRDGLTPLDLKYLDFADRFENALIRQSGRRTLEQSMEAGWTVLRLLPKSELTRLSDAQIAQYIEPAAKGEKVDADA
jgi:V/A-type H+-transporting ATPase subunit B